MGSFVESKFLRVAQASIHFDANNEVLGTEVALPNRRFKRQWSACSDGIAKLPSLTWQEILCGERIQGYIPAFEGFREQQLELQLVVEILASQGIGAAMIGFDIVAFNFLDDLVGIIYLFVFDVEHGIDEVLARERSNAILPAKASEDCTVSKRALPIEV